MRRTSVQKHQMSQRQAHVMKAVTARDIFMSYLELSIKLPSNLAALDKEALLFWIRILAGGSLALGLLLAQGS